MGPDLLAEEAEAEVSWSPYVQTRAAPRQGTHLNVDRFGQRVTVNPTPRKAERPLRVYLLGGSTAFGTGQRDVGTLASALARPLASVCEGVEVLNLGAPGHVFTQGVVELALRLRAGECPDVVIFYHGINEVFSALQNGMPGIPQNESNRVRDFAMGNAVFNWRSDAQSEARAALWLGHGLVSRLRFVKRLREVVSGSPAANPLLQIDVPSAAGALVENHAATARLAEALAAEYGFEALYVWQPTVHTTAKPLTPWESELLASMEASPVHATVAELHREALPRLRVQMDQELGRRFIDLSTVLDTVTAPIYLDPVGHTMEDANPIIADPLARRLLQMVPCDPGRSALHPS